VVGRYVKGYWLAPRYGLHEQVVLTTLDGVELNAALLRGPDDAVASVVLAHGLVNWSRTPKVEAFARMLSQRVHVMVPDLRGHGRSQAASTLGLREPLDVDAAVSALIAAHPGLPVVTVGTSLGAAAVLRHAGGAAIELGAGPPRVSGVVAVSAPAWWGAWEREGAVRMNRWVSGRSRRYLLRALARTRVTPAPVAVPDSSLLMPAISPAFVLIVHDPGDWYFGPEHAQMLFEWAKDPKEIWWRPGAGHGTDLFDEELSSRVIEVISSRVRGPAP
jgi:pimeloyl-ACP methyl ester carboxylesterase